MSSSLMLLHFLANLLISEAKKCLPFLIIGKKDNCLGAATLARSSDKSSSGNRPPWCWLLTVGPDVGMKSSQSASKKWQKVAKASLYIKRYLLENWPNIQIMFGLLLKDIFNNNFQKSPNLVTLAGDSCANIFPLLTSVIYIIVIHFEFKHRCLKKKMIPYFLPNRRRYLPESLGKETTNWLWSCWKLKAHLHWLHFPLR